MTLAARGLSFGFGRRVVGRDVSLEVRAGRIACLLGPNGSGKTTLLRTLLGLLPPLAGEILLEGKSIGDWDAGARARRLAYVPQSAQSPFDFTLLETVQMGRTAHRGLFAPPARHDGEMARRCLERLGLAPLAQRSIHAVSGGERQLALIARALAVEAAYVVMDEPTANLDFANQATILGEIARLRESGTGILFSTHDPDHALAIADHVILLREGGIIASGDVAQAVTAPNLTRLYGSPIEVLDVVLGDGTRRRTCIATAARMA